MILIILFIAACFLAFSNGANDNFKGVATLFGSGTLNYKQAISWATISTLSGSIAAIFLANKLVKNFSGKGLVPDELIHSPIFAISIALGAAITVFIATKIGMPISTTHSLVGGLFGSGVVAVGSAFNFSKLGGAFLMPLIVSPLMAAIVSLLVYLLFKQFKKMIIIPEDQQQKENLVLKTNHSLNTTIRNEYKGHFLGFRIKRIIDFVHFISGGVVGFARGLNDTPKIVGLLIVINTLDIKWGMLAIAITMAIGGLINSKKVAHVMSKKITPLNSGQGVTANLVTGLLVTTASIHGLPVSTTHVSVGSIFGIGTVTKNADVNVVKKIVLSWLLTLPCAAVVSALLYFIMFNYS